MERRLEHGLKDYLVRNPYFRAFAQNTSRAAEDLKKKAAEQGNDMKKTVSENIDKMGSDSKAKDASAQDSFHAIRIQTWTFVKTYGNTYASEAAKYSQKHGRPFLEKAAKNIFNGLRTRAGRIKDKKL